MFPASTGQGDHHQQDDRYDPSGDSDPEKRLLGDRGRQRPSCLGFADGAGEKFEEVESLDDGGDKAVARKTVSDALDRHPEIDMLVGIWAYNGPAAVQIALERRIRDKVAILTFDADQASIRAETLKGLEALWSPDDFEQWEPRLRAFWDARDDWAKENENAEKPTPFASQLSYNQFRQNGEGGGFCCQVPPNPALRG